MWITYRKVLQKLIKYSLLFLWILNDKLWLFLYQLQELELNPKIMEMIL